ncbi:hypothetical protein MUK42_28719 [Musa troglodytarum]|uniref:Uncharacterized protein n=1 Tax=Musa troglodytarum TaxID=320322 RepID=A0A9E7JNJ4_9LILI|nr:hypothetical protein MUK42_28719 [Musa troglodytarum]
MDTWRQLNSALLPGEDRTFHQHLVLVLQVGKCLSFDDARVSSLRADGRKSPRPSPVWSTSMPCSRPMRMNASRPIPRSQV